MLQFSSRLNRYLDDESKLRLDEVADLLDVHRRTIQNLINDNKLPFVWFRGHRCVRWCDLRSFIANGAVIPTKDEAETIVQRSHVDLVALDHVARQLGDSRDRIRVRIYTGTLRAFDVCQGLRRTFRVFESDLPGEAPTKKSEGSDVITEDDASPSA